MDKLSLYELLSFIIPGFLVTFITQEYAENVFNNSSFFQENNDTQDSLLLFCVALFFGIIIHVLTFRIIKTQRLKWYKKLIFFSPTYIVENNEFIKKIIPFLNEDYKNTRKHNESSLNGNLVEDNLFDFAYLYLEVNDKVTPAKNFQSMYFMLRNVFTISIILFPFSIIIYLYKFFEDYNNYQISFSLKIVLLNIIVAIIIVPVANWLREKLLEKVFWSYYVECVHEIKKNN